MKHPPPTTPTWRLVQTRLPRRMPVAVSSCLCGLVVSRRDSSRRLFSELAARFQSLVPIPEEAVRGLSEERLVLNIVDVLFCGEKKSEKPRGGLF